MRISFEQMAAEFKRVLLTLGFNNTKAADIATIFTENSRDGVYTHGLNRFPAFVQHVKGGHVKPDAEPAAITTFGALQQWDGNFGPGMLNARLCMDKAIELAKSNGIGCIAIKNTNHWMRGGTYGWQAAEAGCIGICFTNTIANLPPWGGTEPRLGNNPLVIAVPRSEGHVVLDMAISQYSYGKLLQYQSNGEKLPLPGGYDQAGKLSVSASEIIQSKRLLPVGFWKGSGLSLMLDLLATVLSQGSSTAKVSQSKVESGVSQVFICIRPDDTDLTINLIEQIIDYTRSGHLTEADKPIRYPGEGTLRTRENNLKQGIPVDEKIWQQVTEMP